MVIKNLNNCALFLMHAYRPCQKKAVPLRDFLNEAYEKDLRISLFGRLECKYLCRETGRSYYGRVYTRTLNWRDGAEYRRWFGYGNGF